MRRNMCVVSVGALVVLAVTTMSTAGAQTTTAAGQVDYSTGWTRSSAEVIVEAGGEVAGSPAAGVVVLGFDYSGGGLFSSDGVTWSPISLPGVDREVSVADVAVGDGGFIAVGHTREVRAGAHYAPYLWQSDDGRSWDRLEPDQLPAAELQTGGLVGVTAGPEGFVVVGHDGCEQFVWFSPDGRTWSAANTPSGCYSVQVTPTTSGWVALNAQEEEVIVTTSDDGVQWTQIEVGNTPPVSSLAGRFESRKSFVSDGATQVFARGGSLWVSTDTGRSWDQTAVPGRGNEHIPMTVSSRGLVGYLNSDPPSPVGTPHSFISSPDAATWTHHRTDIEVYDLTSFGESLVAIGPDGIWIWTPPGSDLLAATGRDLGVAVAVATGLLIAGALLLITTRRRLTRP